MRTLLPHPRLRDVSLRPAAVAMVWLGPELRHETVAVPGVALGRGDVLVAVELSTIAERDIRTALRSASVPLVLGHESVGRVVALGDEGAMTADGTEVRIGDRIVWSAAAACGSCDRCRAGVPARCRSRIAYGEVRIEPRWELTGAFASHMHLRAGTTIVRVPEALPAGALAPASGALALAWAAVARAGRDSALEDARVRVYGAGLTGLTAAAVAAAAGASVTVVDPSPARMALASRFGADAAFLADAEPGLAVDADDGFADIVIETSGRAVPAAIAAAGIGATVVLAADVLLDEPAILDADAVARRSLTVAGVNDYAPADLVAAVGFLTERGRAFPFADAVGAVHPLSDIDAALAEASAADAPVRVAVVPWR